MTKIIKLTYLLLLLLFSTQQIKGQKLINVKGQYDNQFRPYAVGSIYNDSPYSDIVSVEFEITYSWNFIKENFLTKDPRKNTWRTKVIECRIPALTKKDFKFYLPNVEDYKPYLIQMKRVKYANGTVK